MSAVLVQGTIRLDLRYFFFQNIKRGVLNTFHQIPRWVGNIGVSRKVCQFFQQPRGCIKVFNPYNSYSSFIKVCLPICAYLTIYRVICVILCTHPLQPKLWKHNFDPRERCLSLRIDVFLLHSLFVSVTLLLASRRRSVSMSQPKGGVGRE